MPTRVTRCSASQSASAPRSALIVANFRLCTRQPPSGVGTRTQATSEAFAMSSPAARSTTVSIVMTLLLARTAMGRWPTGWEPYRFVRLTHVLAATLQGTSPGSRVPFRNGLAAPKSGSDVKTGRPP
jgi:hypothetical protein